MSSLAGGLLTPQTVRTGVPAADKREAIGVCGELLAATGAVGPGYTEEMLAREAEISTFIGEGVAIPHGTVAGRALVRHDALAAVRFTEPVDWGDGNQVVLCVSIAALGDGHLDVLADLAEILMDPARAEALRAATDVRELIRLLTPDGEAE